MLLRHEVNRGVGAALKTGCQWARQAGITTVIAMDADGQHDPRILPEFVRQAERSDLVIGQRFSADSDIPDAKAGANLLGSCLLEEYTKGRLRDSSCGYRAFDPATADPAWPDGYGFLHYQLVRGIESSVLGVVEVPTIYHPTEPWFTRRQEIAGFVLALAGHKNMLGRRDLLDQLVADLDTPRSFSCEVAAVHFDAHYLEGPDAYLIQAAGARELLATRPVEAGPAHAGPAA